MTTLSFFELEAQQVTYAVDLTSADSPRTPAPLMESQVMSSEVRGTDEHIIMLDLDVPARLVASSTEGHSHLYINVRTDWESYHQLLRALEKCGVIERGYYKASVARQATMLRLPWIKKEEGDRNS